MAKSIMIQGTMSNAGKSVLTAGLLRIFHQDGYRAAPFKSQNMALNSYITKDGAEMGRAQVMQAEAAGIEPSVLMNPILLKPTNDTGSQVIVNGEAVGQMSAKDYYKKKKDYIPAVREAYEKLSGEYDIIVIEGAGSPAEINLKQDDIVNMGMAKIAGSPVLLAGDIDRGGVFAQIVGTLALLDEDERQMVKGTIINKFRGDLSILEPGLRILEEKTDVKVRGVVPYFHLDLDEEDSLTERFTRKNTTGLVDIAVIRLPRISNFTDFHALECMEEINLCYVETPGQLKDPDLILIPGSKNTIEDLLWMRQNGLEAKILKHASHGKPVFGICGGYQMLGETISDPEEMEGCQSVKGMGLLPVTTVFQKEKTRTRIQGQFLELTGIFGSLTGARVEGYEIHMGETTCRDGAGILTLEDGNRGTKTDGASSGNVYGCYVHGVFDSEEVRGRLVKALLMEKGYEDTEVRTLNMEEYKNSQYDELARILRESLDMDAIYQILEEGI